MLFLARFAGVAVLVWFYLTAKDKGEPPIKWAILGLIGYWLVWWLVNLTVVKNMVGMFPTNFTAIFLVNQIPAIVAICACFFIRKKLIANASADAEKN